MKIYPVGADLIHVDERTDRRRDNVKLIVAFRSFANAPKNAPSNCNPHLEQAATPGTTPASLTRTGFTNYYAANMLLESNRPPSVQRLRRNTQHHITQTLDFTSSQEIFTNYYYTMRAPAQ